ncbi:MAG: sigma-70 family RNA polymerase sigma factor [Planctomycetota bacterium]
MRMARDEAQGGSQRTGYTALVDCENRRDNPADLEAHEWLARHGDVLFRFALSRVRDRDTAEEIVQETLLAALRARGDFRGASSERTWLVAILRRKVVDHFRRYAESAVDHDPDRVGSFFDRRGHWREPVAQWTDDPPALAQREEFWKVFDDCLSRLSPTMANAFCLREIEQFATDDICKILGLSPSNLWTSLHRARMLLRGCLEANWIRADR